mmetsp:Transcript_10676/g.17820  ORF Transcript_10676/g.17820 Transcript_10676/m.17820 type:complete len:236 (-) Transcript_10676:37-744(-)
MIPCIGRIDWYVDQKAEASESSSGKVLWVDGQDTTYKTFQISGIPLDSIVSIMFKGKDEHDGNFGTFRFVATRDKTFLDKLKPKLPNNGNVHSFELSGDKNENLKVKFNKLSVDPEYTDVYTIYTKEKDWTEDEIVKNPLNGCSVDTQMKKLDPQPTITDADGLSSFTVSNTHRKESDPPFIVVIQLQRTPTGTAVQPQPVLYQRLTVGESARNNVVVKTISSLCTILAAFFLLF